MVPLSTSSHLLSLYLTKDRHLDGQYLQNSATQPGSIVLKCVLISSMCQGPWARYDYTDRIDPVIDHMFIPDANLA